MLFFIWLAAAFVVVGSINLYLRYFGHPRNNSQLTSGSATYTGICSEPAGFVGGGGWLTGRRGLDAGEAVTWLTSSVAWLHHKCSQTPDFIDAWLRALTLEAERQQLEQSAAGMMTSAAGSSSTQQQLQIRFDGVHGPPPELHGVKADTSSADQLTLVAMVSGRDVILQICCFLSSSPAHLSTVTTPPQSEVINCDARILSIKGKIKLVIKLINDELSLSVSFLQPPDVRIQVHPVRANVHVDTQLIESLVRSALTSATTTISWTSSRQHNAASQHSPSPYTRLPHESLENNVQMRSQSFYRNREPITPAAANSLAYQSAAPNSLAYQNLAASSQAPPTSPANLSSYQPQQQLSSISHQQLQQQPMAHQQLIQDRLLQDGLRGNQQKLLVKIIKANGLVDTEWGSCNAYCLVKLDAPSQSFMTNVIRNTVNPLWDEQFIFDIDGQSKTILFEVLDRDKQPDNDLLGRASVLLEEIRRMPSSRQIIPLTGRPRSRTSTSGSVTVELIFLDSQAQLSGFSSQQLQQATAATTAAAAADDKLGQYYTGAVREGTAALSAHDLALTAHQHPGSPLSTSQQHPTLVVTGSEAHTLHSNQGLGAGYRSSTDLKGKDKKEGGFGATLRKKFALKNKTGRAQSVDRYHSSSLRDTSSYLKPPQTIDQQKLAATDDTHVQYSLGVQDQRRDRSNSFGSSIRKIFKRDKKISSHDNSLQRPTPTGAASTGGLKGDISAPRYLREGTPVPPGRQDFQSSTIPLREY